MTTKLTIEQAVIVTGYTGKLACEFSDFHAEVERRFGRPVFTHEFANADFGREISAAFRTDFLAICAIGTPMPDAAA